MPLTPAVLADESQSDRTLPASYEERLAGEVTTSSEQFQQRAKLSAAKFHSTPTLAAPIGTGPPPMADGNDYNEKKNEKSNASLSSVRIRPACDPPAETMYDMIPPLRIFRVIKDCFTTNNQVLRSGRQRFGKRAHPGPVRMDIAQEIL